MNEHDAAAAILADVRDLTIALTQIRRFLAGWQKEGGTANELRELLEIVAPIDTVVPRPERWRTTLRDQLDVAQAVIVLWARRHSVRLVGQQGQRPGDASVRFLMQIRERMAQGV